MRCQYTGSIGPTVRRVPDGRLGNERADSCSRIPKRLLRNNFPCSYTYLTIPFTGLPG